MSRFSGITEWIALFEVRKELIIATKAIMLMSEILCNESGIAVEQKINMNDWLKEYCAAWLKRNKESEVREIEKVFEYFKSTQNR